ncbi:unnamed protein product [Arabidopsis halleri]
MVEVRSRSWRTESNWILYSIVIESQSGLAEFDPSISGVTNPRVDTDVTVICNSMLLISVPGIVIALLSLSDKYLVYCLSFLFQCYYLI